MKTVYFLVTFLKMGGIEIITVNLANALSKRGYNVKIVSLIKDDELTSQLDSSIELIHLSNLKQNSSPFYKMAWRLVLIKMIRQIKSIHKSIIISTADVFNVLLAKYGNNDCLRIGQLHHDYIGRSKLINNFKYNYNGLDVFAVLTDDVRKEISDMIKPTNNRTYVVTIPNFQPDNIKEQSESNMYKDYSYPYCVTVGRMSPVKGYDRLLKIWQLMKSKYDKIPKLILIGDGPEKERLESLAGQMLGQEIVFTGGLNNKETQHIIKGAVCYCMSSYSEAFPLVLMEALSNGTPQVAFDVRVGPRNLIDNGTTGFLIPDDNLYMYAAKVMDIFQNKDLRKDLSEASMIRAKIFSEKSVLQKWIQLFENLN